MRYIAAWPAFHITAEIAEKLETISPATIDRYLKKDKKSLRLKGKSLPPLASLKSRIPIRTFYTKTHFWTFNALPDIKNNAPFPTLEFHSDNGLECIHRFAPFAYGNDYNAAIRRLRHQSRH